MKTEIPLSSFKCFLLFCTIGSALPAIAQTKITFDEPFPFTSTPTLYMGLTFFEQGTGGGPGIGTTDTFRTLFGNIDGASLGNGLIDGRALSNITINFNRDVNDVSLLLATGGPTTFTVSAFDSASELVEAKVVTSLSGGASLGFGNTAVRATLESRFIRRIVVTDDNPIYITVLDDITFSEASVAAEPGNIALMLPAFVYSVAVLYRRRR